MRRRRGIAMARWSFLAACLGSASSLRAQTPEVLDVNDIIESSTGMLDRLIGAHIRMERRLDPALPTIRCDRTQIEQVILNLVVNARDAMPDGGHLLVATDVVDIPRNTRERRTMVHGRYVRLSVADTGVGMDEQTRARIFEPFFTTKARGRGTGLGLAMVYGIVKQSGGYLWVTSAPGAGATFDVFFPALDLPATTDRQPAAAEAHSARAGETVLVVEDEASVRRLALQVLARAGYDVIEAEDGVQALAMAQEPGRRIDLLLTDLVLPGLSGAALAQRFRAVHPASGVLYMTGYSRQADAVRKHATQSGDVLLTKPFSRETLLRAVRAAINRGGAGAAEPAGA